MPDNPVVDSERPGARASRLRVTLRLLLAAVVLSLGAPAAASGYVVADSGAWCWFGDPRAVYHEGARQQTYVGWIDALGAIRIASFDHDSRRIANVVLRKGLAVDDHSNPSLYVRRDGRLMAFWSAHHNGELFYRVTDRPEDITSWGPRRRLGTSSDSGSNYTYPNPLRIQEGLFLFWRGADSLKPAFSISKDEGASWSPARTLIQSQGSRPYVKYERSGRDTIHFAFTDDHPGDVWGGSLPGIYYASYRDGAFYRADGTRIATMSSLPLTPSRADQVYDPTPSGIRSWIHDIATVNGRPVIVYATLPSAGDHRYRLCEMDGQGLGGPSDRRRGRRLRGLRLAALVLGRDRARPRGSRDGLPLAQGAGRVRDRTLADPGRRQELVVCPDHLGLDGEERTPVHAARIDLG